MSCIVRIDNPTKRTHGWQVRAPVPGAPRRYVSRFFADKRHGSDVKAYAAAQAAVRGVKRLAKKAAG